MPVGNLGGPPLLKEELSKTRLMRSFLQEEICAASSLHNRLSQGKSGAIFDSFPTYFHRWTAMVHETI